MIEQVRLKNRVFDINDPTASTTSTVFAFGTHELALPQDIEPEVKNAVALNNGLRIIVDELLVGNDLEEIQCRNQVDDDAFARVPLGANPDDIARCSAADDVLPSSCTGPTAVCLCQNPNGCLRGTTMIGMGEPVGVQDINQDGATDGRQFVAGSVGIQCGAISVPIDLVNSYWNPSGDQNKPAMGGFDALGPAIVLIPNGTVGDHALPTNIDCELTFNAEIVDKQGISVCAPPGGDVSLPCTPGDVSAFKFKTEALSVAPASWENMATGVSPTDTTAVFSLNSTIDPTRLAQVTVKEGTTNFTNFTITNPMPTLIQITWGATLKSNTTYEITFPTGITDKYGQPLPAPAVFTFTTGA
ncbi:MAG TPA: Ig-like domain-containing protein [Kofleriaceae bacterium]|nr:Ig-like domain-containing protein [Kofleriaceae bacterium]